MLEAVRLVQEEDFSVKAAAAFTNEVKKNIVPRTTLNDWLLSAAPNVVPQLGRPTEIPVETERALVKCLKMCAEYQYPMRKSDLQALVQSYVLSNSIKTRWPDGKPGKDWCRMFQRRWRGEVKVKRATNIKRSKAQVSPTIVRQFFERIRPRLEGLPPENIINLDETNIQDDPGKEQAFFGGGTKYFEKIRNSSKVAFTVVFSATASGQLLSPYTIFKSPTGALYLSWCEGGPPGAVYSATPSGWMTMERFNDCFDKASVAEKKYR